jgi:hypothetical protein
VEPWCLRPHSAGSTILCLRPTGSSRACTLRLRPGGSPHALRIPPRGGHPALRLGATQRLLPVRRLRNLLHCWLFVSKVVSSRFLPYLLTPASELSHPLLDIVPGSRDEWDFHPPDSRAVGRTIWPLLTSRPSPNALLRTALPLSRPRAVEISPGKDAVRLRTTATFTSTASPMGFAVLCQLAPPHRPRMWFLFIGSRISPSLPFHGQSPFRSWLQLVFFLSWFIHRGLEPLLDCAHAGHTQDGAGQAPTQSRQLKR